MVLHVNEESSDTVKVTSYILIGVGSLSMAMGFFGCIGAIYEIRCLLGLYFTCLLLILIAQVTAGVLIYFQRDRMSSLCLRLTTGQGGALSQNRLKHEMSNIIKGMIINYTGQNRTTEHTWDYVQKTMKCCGWTGPGNWSENLVIKNSSQHLYSCSCRNDSLPGIEIKAVGLCEHLSAEPPVYETGCVTSVEKWLLENCGVILGICFGVAVVELLGMILSMCLCKSVVQEDYTKVPKLIQCDKGKLSSPCGLFGLRRVKTSEITLAQLHCLAKHCLCLFAMCFLACGYESESDRAGRQPSPEGRDVLLPQHCNWKDPPPLHSPSILYARTVAAPSGDVSAKRNHISGGGGGGDAAVAPLAYFPAFTNQFILLGTLGDNAGVINRRRVCRRESLRPPEQSSPLDEPLSFHLRSTSVSISMGSEQQGGGKTRCSQSSERGLGWPGSLALIAFEAHTPCPQRYSLQVLWDNSNVTVPPTGSEEHLNGLFIYNVCCGGLMEKCTPAEAAANAWGQGEASARGTTMEGDCLSCIKYLMFVFNFLIFLGGSFLLGVGVWVLVDPTGFREIVAANPLLFTGVYIILGMGGMLFLLGFLGCCGAIRENKCLLLFFFMLILLIFLAELAAAILAFIFREHLTREYFTKELKRHYQGYNNTDVFTSTWNAIMTTFDCCGVNSPEDFKDSLFRMINQNHMVPEACCQRASQTGELADISQEQCLSGSMMFRNNKGCYSAVVDYFELYIYVAGALAIVVLTIELFAMVFAMCLFRGIQ
eukprot:superscaffoldBa00000198_g2639